MGQLGGGTFVTQNKTLPGTYINFVSKAKASAEVSDRGFAALPMELDWGTDGDVLRIDQEEFLTDSQLILGYDYTNDKLKGLRDLFLNAKTLFIYRLNGNGTAAQNTYATAKYTGIRGNDITIIVSDDIDNVGKFIVEVQFGNDIVFEQDNVANTDELNNSDYVNWKTNVTLVATAGLPMTGGLNKVVDGSDHQDALDALENYAFNTLGCLSNDETLKSLYATYTKNQRDNIGKKFQCVIYEKKADFEGVINLKNTASDVSANVYDLVYWSTGASAGCNINQDLTNTQYNGEYSIVSDYKQSELEQFLKDGYFVFIKLANEYRILDDINSFVSFTVDKNEDFSSNQVIRVIDNIGNDYATIFNNRYLGKVPNDEIGRVALKNDFYNYKEQLANIRVLQNLSYDDMTLAEGENSQNDVSVIDNVDIVGVMKRLYLTTYIA